MPVFHQMGHQSENLVFEENLSRFAGAIISPVNQSQEETARFIDRSLDFFEDFETIFDPQLYYPQSERGTLVNWQYFPSDVDTADLQNIAWWEQLTQRLAATAEEINVDSVCSPLIHPRNFDEAYYSMNNRIASLLEKDMERSEISVILTAFVSLNQMANPDAPFLISSILTQSKFERVYLVVHSESHPRRELSDPEELKGVMTLIHLLEEAGISVLVGYSSSELLLWKSANATSCATGKFFNLRRFTPSRWEVNDGGGGQVSYLIEDSLISYLLESDIPRVRPADLISDITRNNPYFNAIEQNLADGTAWLGLSWRFFLHWFMDVERRLDSGEANSEELIRTADANWGTIEERDIILEDRQNNGSWIRQWLRAVTEYQSNL